MSSPDQTHNPSVNAPSVNAERTPASSDTGDVIDAIAAVEAQLQNLKKAQSERQRLDAQITDRERELQARESHLAQQFEQLEQDLRVVEQERENLRSDKVDLESARAELSRQQADLDQRRAEMESERAKIDTDRGAMLSDLERRRCEVEDLERQLREREAQITVAATRLEELGSEAAERSSKLELRAQQLEQAEARLAAQADKLNDRFEELEQQAAEARALAETCKSRAEQAEVKRDQAMSAAQSLKVELERVRAAADQIDAKVASHSDQTAQLTRRAEELESQTESLRSQLAARADELAKARERQAEIEAGAATQIEALTRRIETLESTQELSSDQASAATEHADALHRRIVEVEQDLEGVTRERAREVKALEATIAALQTDIDTRTAELKERESEVGELHTSLSIATEKLRSLSEIVQNQMASGDARMSEALEKAVSNGEQLHRRVTELQRNLAQAQQERDALAGELRKLRSGAASGEQATDATIGLRRERLKRMRVMLRDQARKVRRANQLLQDRFSQVEALLSRRAELAAAHQAIQAERSRIDRNKTRSSVAGFLLATVTTVAVLLSLSWVIAGQIKPGTYSAHAIIEASSGPRAMTAEELAEWQTFHEQMLDDPRFIDTLADMLKQRGIASLGTPGTLAAALNENLTLTSPGDGYLHFELRGEGASRTERVLETLTVAVARNANRSRGRRGDGASTIVAAPAIAKPEPIDSERVMFVGSIFGGGMALTSVLGFVLWRRMSTSKTQFERDQQLEALLTEARWQDPRIDIG